MKIENKFAVSCTIFTWITIIQSVLGMSSGESITYIHLFIRFVVTLIAIYSFTIYDLLDHWSEIKATLAHYLVSMAAVFIFTWLTGVFIEPVHPNGYRDIWVNYTCLFIAVAMVFESKRYIASVMEKRKTSDLF